MAAYVVVDVAEVTDPEKLGQYAAQVGETVEKYGGAYIARGEGVALEGDWAPGLAVILQFESVDRARDWYDSAEYAPLRQLRQSASRCNFIAIAGAE